MFSTRKEVDEHVHKMFAKIPPGSERDMKGWAVSRLYIKIQEYSKAIEHLNAFLKVNDDAGAHKLIARCYQQLKHPDYQKALEHYHRSIQLNPKQHDVIIDCCKLLFEQKTLCSPDRASFWLELANTVESLHESDLLLSLRLRATDGPLGSSGFNDSMELVLQKELMTRPRSALLQLRLLQTYIEKKRFDEAFNYAYKTETEMPAQSQSTEWYDSVWIVIQKWDSKDAERSWRYWQLLFITIDRLLQLNLQADTSNAIGESISQLFKLDQCLYKFSLLGEQLSVNGGRELHEFCLDHYAGQLLLHIVTILFKREMLGNKNKWLGTVRGALPLLLLGYQLTNVGRKTSYWQRHCNSVQQKLIDLWRHQSAFRCSQLGRTLHGCVQISTSDSQREFQGLWLNSDELIAEARQQCVNNQWRSQLYQQLYTHPENKLKEQSSILIRDPRLQQPLYEWPPVSEIEEYEQMALHITPPTLEHHVYLGLCTGNLAEAPRVHFYKALRRDCKKFSSNSVETLSQLDVDTFLYAVTLQAQRKLDVQRESYNSCHVGNRNAAARPFMLPFANLMARSELVTPEQNNWWNHMQRIHDHINIGESYHIEHREQLQFGLEVVRCQNEPHIEIVMAFQLGRLLASREDACSLDQRIEAFYKLGIKMLIRHQEKKLEPFYRYFKYMNANSSSVWTQINKLTDDALTYLNRRAIKQGNLQEFISVVHGLQMPMATYLQAEAYRQLADSSQTSRVSRQNFEANRLECLRETKVLLADFLDHPLSSLVNREIKVCLNNERFGSAEPHNNSSAYEDAEDDYYGNAANRSNNRSRRLMDAYSSANYLQLEQTVNDISKQLTVLKVDVGDGMHAIREEFKLLSNKFDVLEELLKKCKISGSCNHEPRTQEEEAATAAAVLGLDEFLNMDEPIHTNLLNTVPLNQTNQDRLFTSSGNTPNATYGGSMISQNQMYNYFAGQAQYMRAPATVNNIPQNFYGPRPPAGFGLPHNIYHSSVGPQYVEGLNYGIVQPSPSLIVPQVSQAQFNQPQAPANIPIISNANFLSSAQLGPTSVQASQQVNQTVQNIAPYSAIQNTLTQQKLITTTSLSVPQLAAVSTSLSESTVENTITSTTTSGVTTVCSGPASSVTFNRELNNQPVEKEPPANVVITSSDPLPKTTVASSLPTLSVTIPAQHIKNSLVHSAELPAIVSSDFSLNADTNKSSNIFSGLSATTFSFKSQVAQAAAEKQRELVAETVNDSVGNESGLGGDGSAELDYDPRPDFKGIIPLPDEVEVRTGEEDEVVKFSHRAKLFRHIDKEWKERGIGVIKILTNQKTECTRLLMRREQTHKICANHKITAGMSLATPEQDKDEKSFLWVANDFADENLKLEKFLVRFKQSDTAKSFKLAFERAVTESMKNKVTASTVGSDDGGSVSFVTSTPAANSFTKQADHKVGVIEAKVDSVVSKTLFGNLTESKTTPKSSPFASFSFGTAMQGTSLPVNLSFGSIAAATDCNATANNSTGFTTAFNFGTNLFNKKESKGQSQQQSTSSHTNTLSQSNAADVDAEDEYEPTAQFAPVIPLPELIDVVTGEENEIILFEHRAKLLRFDKESNEWKERGLGNIKLLQLKTDSSTVRLLMRREQTLKLCCNQRLLPDTKFSFAMNTKNALTWAGQDYADEELTTDLLCVRFKTAEICKEFYDAILKAQTVMSKPKINDEHQGTHLDKKISEDSKPSSQGFGDAFKPKAGSWSCQGCYTNNDVTQNYCVACETPKNDLVPPKPSTLGQSGALNLSSSAVKFSFGFGQTQPTSTFCFGTKQTLPMDEHPAEAAGTAMRSVSLINSNNGPEANKSSEVEARKTIGFGDAFKPKIGNWNCSDCYTQNDVTQANCGACQAPKQKNEQNTNNNAEQGDLDKFDAPSSKFCFGFGIQAASSGKLTTNVQNKKDDQFNFEPPNLCFKPAPVTSNLLASSKFNFSMNKTQIKSPTTSVGVADISNDDETHLDEEENNSYFAPVIPLPDKIDVKTGEEDERILYAQRAKLYRLAENGEWKERGLGEVKILRHKHSKNLRVVMRREQVLKICLNHSLNASVIYKPKDEKSWLFAVHDFSDGESVLQRFVLRFKSAEIAKSFQDTVKASLNGTALPISDDDIIEQAALSATAHDRSLTVAIESSGTSCSGCRGCDPEKFDYGQPPKENILIRPLPLTLPVLMLPQSKQPEQETLPVEALPNRSLIKASSLATNNSANKIGGFGGITNDVSANSTTAFNSSLKIPEKTGESVSGFLFGNTEKSFGQSALMFGGNRDNTQQSIFGGFSGVDNKLCNQTTSIFGNPADGQTSILSSFGERSLANTNGNRSSAIMFGSTAASSTDAATNQSIEGSLSLSNTSKIVQENKENVGDTVTEQTEKKTINCFSDLAAKAGDDFASLAAKGTSNPIGFKKSETGGYFGLTHLDDFKNFKSPSNRPSTAVANEEKVENVNDDDNYDPHYDPIIALPNEIVVTTGEENELKLFGERATLFRYNSDSKEWKERGVGELKILKHNVLNTCRMIMRREQIHKLVLNMKIGETFSLEYMNGQRKSFIWANFNYAESSDGVVERLACRFKKQEQADKFLEIVKLCVADLKTLRRAEAEHEGEVAET